jgi:hypothetical protein
MARISKPSWGVPARLASWRHLWGPNWLIPKPRVTIPSPLRPAPVSKPAFEDWAEIQRLPGAREGIMQVLSR